MQLQVEDLINPSLTDERVLAIVVVAVDGEVVGDLHHVNTGGIVRVRILLRLRRRGARFLVVVLAVDERRESVARVRLDALPDVEHGAAGGVHEDTPDLAQ